MNPIGELAPVERSTVRKGRDIGDLPSVWQKNAEVQWLIKDMIPLDSVTLITAPSGTGKTWLSYAIGGAVAHGRSFLGREVQQRSVLYLDGENPLAIAKRNLADLGIEEIDAFQIWGGWCEASVPSPQEEELMKWARVRKPLLIWDSLVQFHDGDEQSATETRKFMKYFRNLTNVGATVIVLHHTGKSEGSKQYRGSSDIEASVDMAYLLSSDSKGKVLDRLTMKNFKSRFAEGKDFGMKFAAGKGFEAVELPQGGAKPSAESVVRDILEKHPEGINSTRVVELAMSGGVRKHETLLPT
jgi:RecA-family ATPase